MIDEKLLKSFLGDEIRVSVKDLIDSTNAEAKRLAQYTDRCRSPFLIIAREQSAGRGRMGRSFLSRAGRGIFMTLLYFTDKALSDAVSVTTATAAVVAEEIEAVCGDRMRIKWVNDIYNDRGKVCGILVESALASDGSSAVIVGIGINVGEDDFPEELCGIASSIGDISGKEELLIARVAERLIAHLEHPEGREYMVSYRKRFMLEGEDVMLFKNGDAAGSGRVVGVDDDGGLLLIPDGESETVTVISGEVSVRKKQK